MKKILFRAFILCTLIPSMWLSAANAVSEDAECLSLTTEAGATFSVCLEGDVSKAKLTNKTKSQLLELAHQLKKGAVAEPKAKARVNGGILEREAYTPAEPEAYTPAEPEAYTPAEPEAYTPTSGGSYTSGHSAYDYNPDYSSSYGD